MKSIYPILFACVLGGTAYAQNVAINTTGVIANPSAMLDVMATDKGLLVPRVALTSTGVYAPIVGASTQSVLVFNTATAGAGATAVSPGYYYWSGTQWVRLFNTGDAWQTTGNYGTSAVTNYIGTNDATDFVVRTNVTERMRVTSGGNVGVGDATPAALFTVCNGDLFQVVSTGHARGIYGTAGAPGFSFVNDPDCGLFHTALANDIGLSTGGLIRVWISDAGEVYCGSTAPALPGDLFNATASNVNAATSGSGLVTW